MEIEMLALQLQLSLGILGGLVPGPLQIPISSDAQVPLFKIA